MKQPKLTAERMELAFKAAEFRQDLDALVEQYGARLQFGWQGKWAYLQVVFDDSGEALTLCRVSKNGKVRYQTEKEEN